MAIGPDRVQVIRRESAALGGDPADDTDYNAPLNAQADAIECAGVYLQDATNRDESVYVERHGDDMRFRDVNNPTPVTLSALLQVVDFTNYVFGIDGSFVYTGDMVPVTRT